MSFNKRIPSWNLHPYENIEHFHHPRNFPCTSAFNPSHSLPQATNYACSIRVFPLLEHDMNGVIQNATFVRDFLHSVKGFWNSSMSFVDWQFSSICYNSISMCGYAPSFTHSAVARYWDVSSLKTLGNMHSFKTGEESMGSYAIFEFKWKSTKFLLDLLILFRISRSKNPVS